MNIWLTTVWSPRKKGLNDTFGHFDSRLGTPGGIEYCKSGILETWFLKENYPFLILSLTKYCIISPSRRLYELEAQNPLFQHSIIPINSN